MNALPVAPESFNVDSLALHEMEKRLISRMATVARAEAAAFTGNDSTAGFAHHAAPMIKPNLLGVVEFGEDSISMSAAANARVQAMARLAHDVPGTLQIQAGADGTGASVFDVAMARARRVYLALVEADPGLAERSLDLSVRTRAMLPGAPRAAPAVEVYIRPE